MATSQRPAAVTSTAVARVSTEASTLLQKKELAVFASQTARDFIEARLPQGVKFDQVISEVYSCIINEPKLADCTPASLINAVAKACSWGLTIGERVFIVPFKDTKTNSLKATAILGYRGAAELVFAATGQRITAKPFFANELDKFEYEEGTSPYIKHVPIIDPKKRGLLVGGYAVARLNATLPPQIKVMHRDEIDAIRQKHSKQWKTKWEHGKEVPLPLDEILWYVEKTPILQLVKLLPSNPRLAKLTQMLEAEQLEVEDGDELPNMQRIEAPAEPTASAAEAEPDKRDSDQIRF